MFGLAKTKGLASYSCNNLSKLEKDEFTVNSKLELLNKVFEGTRYKTCYKYSNKTFSNKIIPINENVINEHIDNNKNVYFCPVLSKKTIQFHLKLIQKLI